MWVVCHLFAAHSLCLSRIPSVFLLQAVCASMSSSSLTVQVNKAFSQKRKMMHNSLQPLYSQGEVAAALEAVGLAQTARPQELSLHDFSELYRFLCKS